MNAPSDLNPEKQEVINRFLEGDHVLLHVDPAMPGVEIPEHLHSEPTVTLKLSQYFRGAMQVGPNGIIADLLFSGTYHPCNIPYQAIWGCTSDSGKNIIWPEHTPHAVLKQVEAAFEDQHEPLKTVEENKLAQKESNTKVSHLRRVK